MTPVFRERTSWTPIFVVARITRENISALVVQAGILCSCFFFQGLDRVSCFSIRNGIWLNGSEGHVTELTC